MSKQHITEVNGEFCRKREKLIDSIYGVTTVTEWEVKHILRNRELLRASIQDKISTIQHDIIWGNDVIEMVSLPCKQLSDVPKARNRYTDIGDVYEKYQKKLEQRQMELKQMLNLLFIKEEKIERVWGSYLALDEPYYSIVNKMYVQNELYATVEAESGYSRHVFEKYRKEAISLIERFYYSGKSIADLLNMQQYRSSSSKKEEILEEGTGEQLSLADWLENENESKVFDT